MKCIVNGVLYNTETATRVATSRVGDEFDWKAEILYMKENGEFFLHVIEHESNPIPKDQFVSSWIAPIDRETAKKWASNNMLVDVLVQYLGQVEE